MDTQPPYMGGDEDTQPPFHDSQHPYIDPAILCKAEELVQVSEDSDEGDMTDPVRRII